MSARVIRVIETRLATRGRGTEDSPIRSITQYWTEDGDLLAEVDSWQTPMRLRRVEEAARSLCELLEAGCHGGQPDAYVKALRKALDGDG